MAKARSKIGITSADVEKNSLLTSVPVKRSPREKAKSGNAARTTGSLTPSSMNPARASRPPTSNEMNIYTDRKRIQVANSGIANDPDRSANPTMLPAITAAMATEEGTMTSTFQKSRSDASRSLLLRLPIQKTLLRPTRSSSQAVCATVARKARIELGWPR